MYQFSMALVCGLSVGAGAFGATMRYEFTGSVTGTGAYAAYSGGTFTWRSWVDTNTPDSEMTGDPLVGIYAQSLVELVIHKDGVGSQTVFSVSGEENTVGLTVNLNNQTIKSGLFSTSFQIGDALADPLALDLVTDELPGPFDSTFVAFNGSTSYISFADFSSQLTMTTVFVSAELLTPVVPLPGPAGLAAAGLLAVVARRRHR